MTERNYITEQNYPAFKRLYEKALKEGKEIFIFEGQEILVSYAKYVVEYVEMTRK